MTRLPIRWRLTVWFTALLGLVLLLFGGALFGGLRLRLYQDFDDQLRNQAAVMVATVRFQAGQPDLTAIASDAALDEYYIRLVAADGRPLSELGGEPGGLALDPALVTAALAGATGFSSLRVAGDEVLRVITVPVRRGGGGAIVGVLQVGLSRDDLDEALTEFLTILAVTGPLALIVAAVAGSILAGRALAPVAAITTLAARIGGDDLHARLGLDLPDDELGHLARTFDQMLARIEDAFVRQRRFTGDAAHELRTPLSLMRTELDLALARPRTVEEYQAALSDLDLDLERLTSLVTSLLALARSDTGQLVVEFAPFDLADTVSLVLDQFAGAAAAAGVTLRDESHPAPLIGDSSQLIQVLVNLVDNALAHTANGGGIVAGCASAGELVRLWVTDTGVGIAPEHQARVFDRFYRVDAGRTRTEGGAGLGLAICQAIVEAHGGTIALASEPGRGTTVDVRLPAHVERPPLLGAVPRGLEREPAGEPGPPRLGGASGGEPGR